MPSLVLLARFCIQLSWAGMVGIGHLPSALAKLPHRSVTDQMRPRAAAAHHEAGPNSHPRRSKSQAVGRCSHHVSREDAAVSSEGDGSVRARPLVARETFFISFALASVRPFAAFATRSLARSGEFKTFAFHSLACSLAQCGSRLARARRHPTAPPLPLSLPVSSFHLRHLQERSAGGAAGAGALWRCRLEGDLRPRSSLPPSLSLSLSYLN